MDQLRDDPTAHAQSLPASQHNLEDTDETCEDSRYHSDQGSGAQAINYNGHNKLMENGKSVDERDEFKETFDVTMDLIGGIDKRPDSIYKDKSRDECVGPELGLSLKRSCSVSFENQDESKHQKLSLSDASAFSRYACFLA
jgi:pseudo-response regulator 9